AAITGLAEADIVELARLYGTTRPGLIKIADGLQRNHHGGQTVRAICALPAITGQYGRSGAGLAYSTSGHAAWRVAPVHDREQCPPPGRMVNMNRLGAALLGEVSDPPIRSLYVFGANPAAVNPHAGRVVAGMRRDDLFTVVHELFMTDTAELADILLPATSQLEQTDLHSAYGHTMLGYNTPAIAPLGESKSNWDVMRILAEALGFDEPWLRCSADEVIDEVIRATAEHSPAVRGIDLDRLRTEGSAALDVPDGPPFADGHFPTPSGKVELYCAAMNAHGLDPLPHWSPDWDDGSYDSGVASGADASGDKHMGEGRSDTQRFDPDQALDLLSGASHHFVTSSLGNQLGLLHRTGRPFVEIHPSDASARGIAHGQRVIVENGRGWCELVARVTDNVRPGVLASPKGHWSKWHGGRNINWLTSDALGDLANQSTFHSNRVWIRPSDRPEPRLYAVPGPI
ncbi:MAG: molybdopterin dinucleotide binding domain-containing protein, partial [Myxococcota bacterium]